MPAMTDFRVVLVTAPEGDLAAKLAQGLVEAKLAACVNCIPHGTSYYRWEGKLEQSKETLLVIKTRSGLVGSLTRWVKERHSAKVPEIITLSIVEGDRAYLDWLGASMQFAKPAEAPQLPL
jgi:periplasmic divalent cation tolerance protein